MQGFNFNTKVKILLAVALATMLAGFGVMATGDGTISIILLTVSYLVLFPLALIAGKTKNSEEQA